MTRYCQKQNLMFTDIVRRTSLTTSCSVEPTAADDFSAIHLLTVQTEQIRYGKPIRSHPGISLCCPNQNKILHLLTSPVKTALTISSSTVPTAAKESFATNLHKMQTEQMRSNRSVRSHPSTARCRQKQNRTRTDVVRPTALTISRTTVLTVADGSSAVYLRTVQAEQEGSEKSVHSHLSSASLSPKTKQILTLTDLVRPTPFTISRSTKRKLCLP